MITKEMLAEAMNEIDPALIEEHIKRTSPPKIAVRYAVAAIIYVAACIAVVMALPFFMGKGNEPITPNPAVSVTTDDVETTEPADEDVITYDTWEEALEGEYSDALNDLTVLCEYFHEPYTIGEDISDNRVLDLCFRYVLCHQGYYSTLVKDHDAQTVSISESELDSVCKALLGEDVSIRDYDRFLYAYPADYTAAADDAAARGKWETIGNTAHYLKDGIYTFTYATDYWGECSISINYNIPPVIKTDGKEFSITVRLLYNYALLDSESISTATYTFVPTTDCSGEERYTLVSIDSNIRCSHTVQCVINEAMMGFDPSNTAIPLEGTMFTMSVDDSLVSVDGEWKNFMKWDNEANAYVRTLEFVNAYRVDAGFDMDETIHQKAYIGGTQPSFEGVEPIVGTNRNGVEYVTYFLYKSGGFISYTYFRVDYCIIVGFSYGGADEDRNTVLAWCDSVSKLMME